MSASLCAIAGLLIGLGLAGLSGYFFYRRHTRQWERLTAVGYIMDTLMSLKRLRSGNTQGAIKCNEQLLDIGVMRLGQQLALLSRQQRTDDLYWLQQALDYRREFPRSSGLPEVDAEVARSFSLLEGEQRILKQ